MPGRTLTREQAVQTAAARWSDPDKRKVVRLDSLDTHERALVLALIAARKAAEKTS